MTPPPSASMVGTLPSSSPTTARTPRPTATARPALSPARPHRPPPPGPAEGLLATLRSLLEFLVMALFLMTFAVQPFRIPSESMVPTLRVGDFLLVDKQSTAPEGRWSSLLPPTALHRGELAVFRYPVDPSMHLVKRIVALPGDRLQLRAGRVFVDGAPLREPYAFYSPSPPNDFRDNFPSFEETDPNLDPRWWRDLRRSAANGTLTVPPGQVFVLGDNRNNSEDSRYWGFVPETALVGRPLLVYFSLRDPADERGRTPRQRLHDDLSPHILH